MDGTPERTPETATGPIGLIVERWVTRLSGFLRDGRVFRSRLEEAGAIEQGAIALEAAIAAEDAAAGCLETARLLRAYARRDGPTTQRDIPAARPRRRWTSPRMITALATVVTAAAAILAALLTHGAKP